MTKNKIIYQAIYISKAKIKVLNKFMYHVKIIK